jgi:hypothetical protein
MAVKSHLFLNLWLKNIFILAIEMNLIEKAMKGNAIQYKYGLREC